MNDPFVHSLAQAFASGVMRDTSLQSEEDRIRFMWQATLGRQPREEELQSTLRFLDDYANSVAETAAFRNDLKVQGREVQAELATLKQAVETRIRAKEPEVNSPAKASLPEPIIEWDFEEMDEQDLDAVGARLVGSASIQGGALLLDGRSYLMSGPLEVDVAEKTLEAWVQLDRLDQRGGGVVSIQSRNGDFFDAIVFGEQEPQHWLAGSNHFARTESFRGPVEADAMKRWVHMVIAYDAQGQVTAYRDGEPYGDSYRSSGLYQFHKGETLITVGLRHLPGGGNRFLSGRVSLVRVFGQALSDNEVKAAFRARGTMIGADELQAEMSIAERQRYAELGQRLQEIEQTIVELGPEIDAIHPADRLTELARALFMTKEFIYVP